MSDTIHEYVRHYSSAFITSDNYNTVYVLKDTTIISLWYFDCPRIVFKVFALVICLTCENVTILKQMLCEAVKIERRNICRD